MVRGLAALKPIWLVVAFLTLAMPAMIFLGLTTPPFQSPDEPAHFFRAYQIRHGGLVSAQPGAVDKGILQLESAFSTLPFHPEMKTTPEAILVASTIVFTGITQIVSFPNTGAYTPLHYLPQVVGIAAGEAFHLSVLRTLQLSRILNGLAALALASWALSWCRHGRFFMFAALLLPMSLSLYASSSQDGLLIPAAALCFAILSRVLAKGCRASWSDFFLLMATLLFVVVGRPPYAPLVLIFLIPRLLPSPRPMLVGVVAISVVLVVTGLWLFVGSSFSFSDKLSFLTSDVNPKRQLAHLLQHWYTIPSIAFRTLAFGWKGYLNQFIGVLGWLDTKFPISFYLMASVPLVLALAADMGEKKGWRWDREGLILGTVLTATCSLFLAEYLIWTKVGSPFVEGVQGRYLIPLAFGCGLALPGLRLPRPVKGVLVGAVLVLPLATLSCVPAVLIDRYYFTSSEVTKMLMELVSLLTPLPRAPV